MNLLDGSVGVVAHRLNDDGAVDTVAAFQTSVVRKEEPLALELHDGGVRSDSTRRSVTSRAATAASGSNNKAARRLSFCFISQLPYVH